jgi:hypothetical protein
MHGSDDPRSDPQAQGRFALHLLRRCLSLRDGRNDETGPVFTGRHAGRAV